MNNLLIFAIYTKFTTKTIVESNEFWCIENLFNILQLYLLPNAIR